MLTFFGSSEKPTIVEFSVYEYPKATPQTLRPLNLKPPVERSPEEEAVETARKVFGMSSRTLTESEPERGVLDSSVSIKAGNTLAVAPDDEELQPGDEDSLPIPADEFLVTSMPAILEEVRIPYPEEAKKKEIQGPVVMDLLIDETGRVREVLLVDGPDPILNREALQAAKEIRFQPARVEKNPVAVRIRYTYRFVLES